MTRADVRARAAGPAAVRRCDALLLQRVRDAQGDVSRHGAQMICTPIGKGDSGTGATTTGRPMKEIGCV